MKNQTMKANQITKIANDSLIELPTPTSISYMWNMGSLLSFCLVTQILTGLILAMYFSTDMSTSFESITHLTRDVNNGWLLRSMHANGATLFFILIYIHMARGLLFNSPTTKKSVWTTGMMILVMVMATAFLGYVLPWGQMSFWGATVITNIFSAIPILGKNLVEWMWGGFSVGQPTLTRFFALHFMIPMVISLMFIIHLMMLHKTGSSTPTGTNPNMEKSQFHPFFSSKDSTPVILTMTMMMVVVTNFPLLTMDAENFSEANPLVTPIHIQPEWYFLFAYAILRSIPSKIGGVIALMMSILTFTTPMMKSKKQQSKKNNPTEKMLMWATFSVLAMLTWIGANPVEAPMEKSGQFTSVMFFALMATTLMCLL